MANEAETLKAELSELRRDVDELSAAIREQIHGSMDANQPGIASRL